MGFLLRWVLSMIYVRVIDENGLFIEDTFVEELTEFTIETPCPAGFYRPKWNGEAWEEGATQEYIDNLKINAPKAEPTLEERLTKLETENALLKTKVATIEATPTLKTEPAIKEPIISEPIVKK